MNEFEVAGRIDSMLTHFAALGLTAILDEGSGDAMTWWPDGAEARAIVGSSYEALEVAERVLSHARRHTVPSSWVQRRIAGGTRSGSGLFTARVRPPATTEEWTDYARQRTEARPTAVVTPLDEQMQSALGEPAWWRCVGREKEPDQGASRWEMKTRERGREFLVDRLAPLADALACRDVGGVLDGLTGRRVLDETGKSAPDSRTGTGLAVPGPVDTAIAWCALWGLHTAPTVQRIGGFGQSPAVWPRTVVHPREAMLPVYAAPVTPRAFSEVLSSEKFDQACGWTRDGRTEVVAAARAWLKEHGVKALLRSEMRVSNTKNPERYLLNGTLVSLDPS